MHMKNKYKHIFFDLDRTLWHFDENSKRVLNTMFSDFKLNDHIPTAAAFIDCYQQINEALWDQYREGKIEKDELRWKRFAETLEAFELVDDKLGEDMGEYYVHHSPRQKELLPHARKVLDYLKDKYTLFKC